jgi:LuxR family maltose regulon positive regulatory protein
MVILESKISIPNYSPYLIRNRLFSFIEDHLDRSLICLISDGGYGKTTLIASFINEKNIPAIWYQLSPQDRNPHTFLSYMKTSISRKMSGGHYVHEVRQETAEEELDNLVSILSAWPSRLLIVLDNYQSIHPSEEIEKILTKMIAHSSPFITFIITSRVRPNIQLIKLKLQNRLAELETKDLAFMKDEILQYFVTLHGLSLHDHEIDLIFHKTKGWVASLQLLQDVIKNMSDADRSSFWIKFSGTSDIYDYLGSEILDSQSDEVRMFLYKTCLLTDLNADVIDKYLGIDRSEEILEHLLKNHLFIYKTNHGTITFHNLFRSFLYKELLKRENKAAIENYHMKLSSIYQQRSDLFNAFAHAVASNNFLTAAEIMTQQLKERYRPDKFLELIDVLAENILPNLSSASLSFFLFRCIPLEIVKDLIEPMESFIHDANNNMSPLLSTHFKHLLAVMQYYIGEINISMELCEHSLRESMKIKDDEMISINLAFKANLYYYMGNYEEAKRFAQEALSIPDFGHFHPHHIALWILAEVSLGQKDLQKAMSFIKETLKLSEQRFDCSIIYPYCSMGKYYRFIAQYEESLNWIHKAEELAVKFNLSYDLGWIYLEMALTYLEHEQWEKADLYLSKSSGYYAHSTYLKCVVKQNQIKVWNKLGKHDIAGETQKEMEQICKEKNYYWLTRKPTAETPNLPVMINESSDKLSISVLGKFEMRHKGKIISLKRKSSFRLLQYFITHREGHHLKESIVDEIFPEGPTKSVYTQFYVALSHLRKTLEPGLKSGRESLYIKQSGSYYSFCLDHIDLDVHEFTRLILKKDGISPLERIANLKRAELLYRGDYFEGHPYISFIELERERYHVLYLNVLQELACYYWDQSDYQEGIRYFEKALKKEPFEESIYMEYIRRLLGAGLYLRAKKVSEMCQKFIGQELGVPVQAKLQQIFNQYTDRMKAQIGPNTKRESLMSMNPT